MNILIDTHIFLWLLASPEKIDKKYLQDLESPVNTVYLSAMSVAEIMIKSSIGKLEINFDPIAIADKSGITLLDFSAEDAILLKSLPFHHKDPFDRMLISQSINRGYAILTSDTKFDLYQCKLWK